MDNTTPETRVQVAQKLRRVADVVAELEEAGMRIIQAEGTITRMDNVLLSIQEPGIIDAFRGWLSKKGLDYAMDYKPNNEPDPVLDLAWEVSTVYNMVRVHGYLTREDKAEWEKKGDNDETV